MAISMPKKLAIVGAGAAVLGLGIAVPATAFARDPSPSPSGTASATDSPDSDREQRKADRLDRMAELLASELGIDKARVADALAKVEDQMDSEAQAERKAELSDRLAGAVADGKLTQQQADAILEAAEAGVLPFGGPGRMPGHGR